jgi:hypothetical protein
MPVCLVRWLMHVCNTCVCCSKLEDVAQADYNSWLRARHETFDSRAAYQIGVEMCAGGLLFKWPHTLRRASRCGRVRPLPWKKNHRISAARGLGKHACYRADVPIVMVAPSGITDNECACACAQAAVVAAATGTRQRMKATILRCQ